MGGRILERWRYWPGQRWLSKKTLKNTLNHKPRQKMKIINLNQTFKEVHTGLMFASLCVVSAIQAQSIDYVAMMTNTPGLVGYWRFDPPFPTNSLVNGYMGTNEGGATIGSPGSGCPLAGYPNNQALVDDGTGYLNTDLYGRFTNQFTLMCWVNVISYPGQNGTDGLYTFLAESANGDDCDLLMLPDGTIGLWPDGVGNVLTTNALPLNQWHFIVGTFTNTGPRCLYVDGQLVGANIGASHRANSSQFAIGYSAYWPNRRTAGSIDEAAVFNRALSASEVGALYLASGPTNLGTLQSITLNVPPNIQLGTLQTSVTANFSSGAALDVTGLSSYASSDTNVLTISSSGLVTAHELGSATLTATYGGLVSTQSVTAVSPAAVLTHRYSFFRGNANDSIGAANGTLQGTAALSGGALTLPDGNGCVSLPAGAIDSNYVALSIEVWANISRTPNGATNVIAALGNPGAFVRLGTHDANGNGNAWIEDQSATGYLPGPITGTVHLAAVWNQGAGDMEFYVNGYPANGGSVFGSLTGISGSQNLTNIIGASVDGTAGIVGSIQECRIYSGALSLDQIRTSLAAGPTNAPLVSNQISARTITNLTVMTHPNFIVGTIQDPVVLASSASVRNIDLTADPSVTFVSGNTNVLVVLTNNQVQAVGVGTTTLTATGLGASGQTTVTTTAAPALKLTHHYSFVSDASDSASGENGTLMGDATANYGLILNSENDGLGYGDYLLLPRDIVGGYPAMTVETWVNLGTQQGSYCRLFSFGSSTYGGGYDHSAMLLSPEYPGPTLTLIVDPVVGTTPAEEMDLPTDQFSANIALQNSGLVQVVAVLDPLSEQVGAVYYNGQLAGVRQFTDPLTAVDVQQCLIGKSASRNDPFLIGAINDLRVYYGAMTAGQVASNYAAVTNSTNTAIVAVNQGAAYITDPPLAQTVLAGQPVVFSVGAVGAPPLSYQWFVGTNVIPGATAATYIIPTASTGNAGLYSVQVSNSLSAGSPAVSAAVQLTVDSAVSLTNGLLLHLSFDGTYNDLSGNGYDGQAGGTPTFVAGIIGSGAVHVNTAPPVFNYVSVPASAALSYAGDFTVSFWQRHAGLPNDLPMVGNSVNSTYQPGWVLTDDFGRQEASLDGAGLIVFDPADASPLVNDGRWHQAALVINRELEVAVVYVDGNPVASQTLVSLGDVLLGDLTDPNNNTLTIGQDPTGTYGVAGEYDIDDLVLWNRALLPSEVRAVYVLGQAGQSIINGFVPETLTAQFSAGALQLTWNSGALQSAPTVLGPWTDVSGASAPSYNVPIGTGNQFFRVKL
jgi:hypothetical protein